MPKQIKWIARGQVNEIHSPFTIYSAFGKSLCTYKRCWKSIVRTFVSKKWIKQLHTSLVLHFNRYLTTEYSETTAHRYGNFDTDNQIYVL
jgi:hypothetical protein